MYAVFTCRVPHGITNFWISTVHKGSTEFNWHKFTKDNLKKNKIIESDVQETTFRLQAKYNDTAKVNCSRLRFTGKVCYPSSNPSSFCPNFSCGDGCIGG